MKTHLDYSDRDFIKHFTDLSFPADLFNHEAHLRFAFIHIDSFGKEGAVEMVTDRILKYVSNLGAEDKYHETLTVSAVEIVNHFMQKAESKEFVELLEEYPRLQSDFKSLLYTHYSSDILNSEEAKSRYLEPDLLPFEN